MNKKALEEFIKQIEIISNSCDKREYVKDKSGKYLKHFYLKQLIQDAREFIMFGEYEIALENMLENLNEVSIVLDVKIVDLAYQAYGEKITKEKEVTLDIITRK